jgi:hypothetical protein
LAAESGNKFDAKGGNRKSADESSREADATMGASTLKPRMDRRSIRATFVAVRRWQQRTATVLGFEGLKFGLSKMCGSVTNDSRASSRCKQTAAHGKKRSCRNGVGVWSLVAACGRLEGKEQPPQDTSKAETILIGKPPQY